MRSEELQICHEIRRSVYGEVWARTIWHRRKWFDSLVLVPRKERSKFEGVRYNPDEGWLLAETENRETENRLPFLNSSDDVSGGGRNYAGFREPLTPPCCSREYCGMAVGARLQNSMQFVTKLSYLHLTYNRGQIHTTFYNKPVAQILSVQHT